MAWIFLEALAALLLAIVIVVWTMGPKRKRPDGATQGPTRETTGDAGEAPPR